MLNPDWNQDKPPWQQAREMCSKVALEPIAIRGDAITETLQRLRNTHSNGGVLLTAVRVGESAAFDWFASRNRLLEYEILPSLLRRTEIKELIPELSIPAESTLEETKNTCGDLTSSNGFKFDNPFLFDGKLAQNLHAGGAYPSSKTMDGKEAKQLALAFCDCVFGQRYEEISLFSNHDAWTPWFGGIAWDWTAVLFDRRARNLWIFAVTDTD